jgi:hypothetical protein
MNPNKTLENLDILSGSQSKWIRRGLRWFTLPLLRRAFFRYNPLFTKYPGRVVNILPGLTVAQLVDKQGNERKDCGDGIVSFSTGDKFGHVWDSRVPPTINTIVYMCGLFYAVKRRGHTKKRKKKMVALFVWPSRQQPQQA